MTDATPAIDTLLKNLDQALFADRHRLRRQLHELRKQPDEARLAQWLERFQASAAKVEARRQSVPRIRYDDSLPIAAKRDEIKAALEKHQVLVIAGETGSGKTTQLPKICLEIGRGVHGLIGHTQPRRLAARASPPASPRSSARRWASWGYQVRFEDQSTERTLIKLMTDGILLAETQHDRFLEKYDTIIVDEAHERSLNIDFLLGFLKTLLPPAGSEGDHHLGDHRPGALFRALRRCTHRRGVRAYLPGGNLVSPAGCRDRRGRQPRRGRPHRRPGHPSLHWTRLPPTSAALPAPRRRAGVPARRTRDSRRRRGVAQGQSEFTEVLPLYARLTPAEQQKIFQPRPGRKIVLATNVAETSLTVPGIRYVIDSGTARISRYSYRAKVQRLPIEAVSQASANQRKGRCGRVEPGICIRLYSEEDFLGRPAFTDPEILRTNLAAVILQMLHLRLGDIQDFYRAAGWQGHQRRLQPPAGARRSTARTS